MCQIFRLNQQTLNILDPKDTKIKLKKRVNIGKEHQYKISQDTEQNKLTDTSSPAIRGKSWENRSQQCDGRNIKIGVISQCFEEYPQSATIYKVLTLTNNIQKYKI